MALLRDFIRECLLLERWKPRLDLKALDKFKYPEEAVRYVETLELPFLGRGSSRTTFRLSSRSVLKVARNVKGIAQNEAELDVYTDPKTKPVIAKVRQADDRFFWLVSELVRPLDAKEFKQLTGFDEEHLFSALNAVRPKSNEKRYGEKYDIRQQLGMVSGHQRKWFNALAQTMRRLGLGIGDLIVINHYGKTADGQVVLLDYGATETVLATHYNDDSSKSSDSLLNLSPSEIDAKEKELGINTWSSDIGDTHDERTKTSDERTDDKRTTSHLARRPTP